jgi:hypothetical protein
MFSRSFALAGEGFHHTAPIGGEHVWTWESPTRSAVTICRFLRENTPRGSSIAARIVAMSFRESAAFVAQSPVLPAAASTTAVNSIRSFGCDCFIMSSEVETSLDVSDQSYLEIPRLRSE